MSETRTITVFTFEELSEEGTGRIGGNSPKDRARNTIAEWLMETANEGLYDLFSRELSEWGFPTDKDSIEWSLGYSQGDGVAFYGTVDVKTYLHKSGHFDAFEHLLCDWADPSVTIERNSFGTHYSHWNTMTVDVEYYGEETPRRDRLIEKLREQVSEDVKTVSRQLETMGYAEFEHATSDDNIREHCEANEYRFLASGSLAPWGDDDDNGELPYVVVDTLDANGDPLQDGDQTPILGRFPTESAASTFIGTLPDCETGRYGLDGPVSE